MFKLFAKSNSRQPPGTAPSNFAGFKRDPLTAIPHRNRLAEHRADSNGCYQIRIRPEPAPGLKAYLARTLGFHADVRVNLDAHGSFFWALIDGRRNLYTIANELGREYNLTRDQSRKSVLQFTKALMLRHLIQLDHGQQNRSGQKSPSTEASGNV